MIVQVQILTGMFITIDFYSIYSYHVFYINRMVALMSPEDSWVARWQKISKY